MRKKPFTNKELFNEIVRILKESNKLPDILDYALSDSLISFVDIALKYFQMKAIS